MVNSFYDKVNKEMQKKHPELYSIGPRKRNDLAFLKSCPYRRSMFHYYSNPVIGYNHVLDPSHPKGLPKKTIDIPRAKSVKKEFRGCFPEMKGTMKGKSYKSGKLNK
jgi:hypothetical protein